MTIARLLAKRIRELRRVRRLSQEQLALKAGSSVASVSNIERGLSLPNLKMIERLARALKVPASDLILQSPSGKADEHFSKIIGMARKLSATDLELAAALLEALSKARHR